MRILIADDDITSRTVLAVTLREQGHEVEEAVDGEQACRALERPDAPPLAILDWMMPELDGLEVVRRVRNRATERPPYLLMLTSKSEKAEIVLGLDAGANDYLTKPFDPGELRARVEAGRRAIELQNVLIESREAMLHQATHDALTGLLNRRAILDQLRMELTRTRRNVNLLAVGTCDIDYFKRINDTHGHLTGDDVLCGLADILRNSLRPYDSVGRLGGEEFIFLMPVKGDLNFLPAFERLCDRIARTGLPTRSGELSVTVSIGVACATGDCSVDEVLEASDRALYRAKSEGRNRVMLDPPTAAMATEPRVP